MPVLESAGVELKLVDKAEGTIVDTLNTVVETVVDEADEVDEQTKVQPNDDEKTTPVTRYIRFFRHTFDRLIFRGILFGGVALIIQFSSMLSMWERRTSWLTKVPCLFQDQLVDFARLTQISNHIIEFATLLPALGFVMYGSWYLRPDNRHAHDADWKPLRTSTVAALYFIKILVPILLYSIINFKLPFYVPYEKMAIKACGVTASLAIYPPGRVGNVTKSTYEAFRDAQASFLSNDANLLYASTSSSMERKLANLNETIAGDLIDESSKCLEAGVTNQGPLSILNSFLAPPKGINDFCKEAFRVATEDMNMPLSDALEFPLKILGSHLNELFTAAPLAYYGCSRDMSNAVGKRPTPDPALSFSDLCTAFYSSPTFDKIPEKYRSFGVSQTNWEKYASHIAEFRTEEERQWSCAIFAGLLDPRTGFDPVASQLCPRWITFQYQKMAKSKEEPTKTEDELNQYLDWNIGDESIIALSSNPFDGANKAGFFEPKKPSERRNWAALADTISDITFSLHGKGIISNYTQMDIGRWAMNDVRSLAQLGSNYLIETMQRIASNGQEAQIKTVNRMTDSITKLVSIMQSSLDAMSSSLQKTTTNSINETINGINNGLTSGIASIASVFSNELMLLSYDLEYQVYSDWNLTTGGQNLGDPCGDPSNYPANRTSCEEKSWDNSGTKCMWSSASGKCGFSSVNASSFRDQAGQSSSSRASKSVQEAATTINSIGQTVVATSQQGLMKLFTTAVNASMHQVILTQAQVQSLFFEMLSITKDTFKLSAEYLGSMVSDLSITSSVGMLKTSQLVSEKAFEATNAAIRLVRYTIGTYIGFSVVSKLLPFALAIVAGIQKGTKAFTKITTDSKAFLVPGDAASLKKFNALLLFISGLVVAVPMIAFTIFFYQAFADQYFVMVVLGVETKVVGAAFMGFLSQRQNKFISLVSKLLILAGLICWILLDDQSLFLSEYLVAESGKYLANLSFIKILTRFTTMGFNYYFSQVITAQLIARLSAEIFAHGISGDVAYLDGEGKVEHVSNLDSLDVWAHKVREKSQKDAGAAGIGMYKAEPLLRLLCGAKKIKKKKNSLENTVEP